MGRPATGSVRWNKTERVWTVRVTTAHGRSKPIAMTGLQPCAVRPDDPERGCTCGPCAFARTAAIETARVYRESGAVPNETSLTVSDWFSAYYKAAAAGTVGRKNRGRPQAAADDRKARFDKWIAPEIGTIPMACVTSADLRRVVQRLDEAIHVRLAWYREREEADEPHEGRKPGISPKTAANVFGEITSGFKEACNSKLDELRVLDVNPAIGVQGPITGEEREQAALFPDEVRTLLACDTVALERRRCYAVAIYAGLRRSELERLEAADVDLEHDVITVRGKKSRAAKRQVPIEPAIRPLLEHIVKTRKTGPLLDVPRADGKGGSSDLIKRDLERAGLTRADLFRDDAEHMPFTFHGLRHTAITHWAVAGRDARWLQLVAGHTDAAMTMRYLDKAAVVRGSFGAPHPPLPPGLSGIEVPSEFRHELPPGETLDSNSAESQAIRRPQRESKAAELPPESTAAASDPSEKSSVPREPTDGQSPVGLATTGDPDAALAELVGSLIARGHRARALAVLEAYNQMLPVDRPEGVRRTPTSAPVVPLHRGRSKC